METTAILTKIVKRDGKEEDFAPQKITAAIEKAGEVTGEFGEEVARALTLRALSMAQQFLSDHTPNVEEIQDIVEEVLLFSPYKKTAKAYILYREKHSQIREVASKFNADLVDQYLKKNDWKIKEV